MLYLTESILGDTVSNLDPHGNQAYTQPYITLLNVAVTFSSCTLISFLHFPNFIKLYFKLIRVKYKEKIKV